MPLPYNDPDYDTDYFIKKQQELQLKISDAERILKRAKDELAIQNEVLAREKNKSLEIRHLYDEIGTLEKTVKEFERQTRRLADLNHQIEDYLTKGDPKTGGLFGWSEKKADNRLKYLEQVLDGQAYTVHRYPTIESPDEVRVAQEFSVQISLTEDLITSNSYIKHFNKKSVSVTEEGQLSLGLPEQEEWKIDVTLFAPAFTFYKNTSSMTLPKSGDSTPAIFYLKAKPIKTDQQISKLYATLWHISLKSSGR
jgi:hypothetical protein